MAAQLTLGVAGAVMVGLAVFDALTTTLPSRSAAGPLTSRIGRLWWRLVHGLAGRPDFRWLTSAGPVIAVLTLSCWLLLL